MNHNELTFYVHKEKIKENFLGFQEQGTVFYPVKANSNPKIIKLIDEMIKNTNNGYLISYVDHFHQLKVLGVDISKICLMNVLMSKENVKYLYEQGVRFFVFDHIDALNDFLTYAALSETKIALRLSTIEVFNIFTQLGACKEELLEMINRLKDCASLGISFYLNDEVKRCKKNALDIMLEYIISEFKDVSIDFLSIGGVTHYKNLPYELIQKLKKSLSLKEVILEPGKYLIGDTMDLETPITRVREICGIKAITMTAGIYSGMLDLFLYNTKFEILLKLKNGQLIPIHYNKMPNDIGFYLYGGSSDNKDVIGMVFIDKTYAHELCTQNNLLIKNVGAYFEEFFMKYGCDINKSLKTI